MCMCGTVEKHNLLCCDVHNLNRERSVGNRERVSGEREGKTGGEGMRMREKERPSEENKVRQIYVCV